MQFQISSHLLSSLASLLSNEATLVEARFEFENGSEFQGPVDYSKLNSWAKSALEVMVQRMANERRDQSLVKNYFAVYPHKVESSKTLKSSLKAGSLSKLQFVSGKGEKISSIAAVPSSVSFDPEIRVQLVYRYKVRGVHVWENDEPLSAQTAEEAKLMEWVLVDPARVQDQVDSLSKEAGNNDPDSTSKGWKEKYESQSDFELYKLETSRQAKRGHEWRSQFQDEWASLKAFGKRRTGLASVPLGLTSSLIENRKNTHQ